MSVDKSKKQTSQTDPKPQKSTPQNAVERGLHQRAAGSDRPVIKPMMHKGQVVMVKYLESQTPDTRAAVYWLTNRHKNRWSLKPVFDPDEGETTWEQFARETSGTALRPREDSGYLPLEAEWESSEVKKTEEEPEESK